MDVIRKAKMSDIMQITHIYNQAINARKCTCDLEHRELNDRISWYEKHDEKTPVYVFERDGIVLGYSYISAYREGRRAVETVGEVSFYVDYSYHKKGIGSYLLKFIISQAKKIGYTHLLAIVIECNKGSISLLNKFNFTEWGRLPNVVNIDNSYYSHLYYGISL